MDKEELPKDSIRTEGFADHLTAPKIFPLLKKINKYKHLLTINNKIIADYLYVIVSGEEMHGLLAENKSLKGVKTDFSKFLRVQKISSLHMHITAETLSGICSAVAGQDFSVSDLLTRQRNYLPDIFKHKRDASLRTGTIYHSTFVTGDYTNTFVIDKGQVFHQDQLHVIFDTSFKNKYLPLVKKYKKSLAGALTLLDGDCEDFLNIERRSTDETRKQEALEALKEKLQQQNNIHLPVELFFDVTNQYMQDFIMRIKDFIVQYDTNPPRAAIKHMLALKDKFVDQQTMEAVGKNHVVHVVNKIISDIRENKNPHFVDINVLVYAIIQNICHTSSVIITRDADFYILSKLFLHEILPRIVYEYGKKKPGYISQYLQDLQKKNGFGLSTEELNALKNIDIPQQKSLSDVKDFLRKINTFQNKKHALYVVDEFRNAVWNLPISELLREFLMSLPSLDKGTNTKARLTT